MLRTSAKSATTKLISSLILNDDPCHIFGKQIQAAKYGANDLIETESESEK